MALDSILLKLTEPQKDHAQAVHLGRLGFLEWLVSLPEHEDFRQQALIAYARASPLQMVVPAVGVLCSLLEEAAQEHSEATGQNDTLYLRRKERRSRGGARSGTRGGARGGTRGGTSSRSRRGASGGSRSGSGGN